MFYPENLDRFSAKAFDWATQFSHSAYFCPNGLDYLFHPFLHFLAVDAVSTVIARENSNSFENLQKHHDEIQDWLVGNLTYDLKNEIEKLKSVNSDLIGFESVSFFQPRHLIFYANDHVEISSFDDPTHVFEAINDTPAEGQAILENLTTSIQQRVSKEAYLQNVRTIQDQIINGEVYELNYCIEFFGHNQKFNPYQAFQKLNARSPMPFATFQKFRDKFLICASPERFLKKTGDKIISQPIKGTIRRGKNEQEDEMLRIQLQTSEKERAENMMIVDLVRNDLAKSGLPGTIKVEELFGIYSYQHIHQMVSTITATQKANVPFAEIIRNAFPMGSMTGAPKVSAMKLIETLEESKRGLFSGAAGYITPDGDFDFNVVIRSILYNQSAGNLSFQVGSAITYDSIPEKEYDEVLLKAAAIFEILKS